MTRCEQLYYQINEAENAVKYYTEKKDADLTRFYTNVLAMRKKQLEETSIIDLKKEI